MSGPLGNSAMATVRNDPSGATELLERVRAGSTDALGELYRIHAEMVYGLAYRTTGSREEAEEVLQDVFVGLSRALRNYREQGRFESWLKRLVVRTALMRMRSVRRKREVPLEARIEEPETSVAHVRPLDRIMVQRALERLPDSLRVVFVLKEIEGFSHADIARMLGISSGNSATRLSRAWALLRKEARP